MFSYVRSLLAVTVCFYLTVTTLAQTNGGTPDAVVQTYWATMRAAEWAKCADLIHPQALRRIRKSSDRFVAALTVFGEGNLLNYFGVATRHEYMELSDAAVLERLLRRMAQQPGYQEIVQATKYELLGTVKESDDLVHVLYRSDVVLLDAQGRRLKVAKFEQSNEVIGLRVEVKIPELNEERVSVISVKKNGDSWLILPGDDVEKTLSEWEKSIEQFQGHMKKFADALLAQQKAKSQRKRKPQRRTQKR